MRNEAVLPIRVLHVGIVGPYPGGMAQVVNGYLTWDFSRSVVRACCSTAGKHDNRMAIRVLMCLMTIINLRLSSSRKVVVVHLSERGSFIREGSIILVCRVLRLPVIGHLHGARFVPFAKNYSRLVRFILRQCSSVFVLTDETMKVVKNLGVGDVRMVQNCVELPATASHEKKKCFLFGGEISSRKGVDVLVEAWKLSDVRGWRLVLAGPLGSGFDRESFSHESIDYLGSVAHSEMLKLQEQAAVAILPSRDEALPMFLIESMARACAIVSTTVGEIPGLVSEREGILCAPGSVKDLVGALNAMASPSSAEKYGLASYEAIVARYDAAVVLPRLEDQWISVAR